jgi:hypothetical protein
MLELNPKKLTSMPKTLPDVADCINNGIHLASAPALAGWSTSVHVEGFNLMSSQTKWLFQELRGEPGNSGTLMYALDIGQQPKPFGVYYGINNFGGVCRGVVVGLKQQWQRFPVKPINFPQITVTHWCRETKRPSIIDVQLTKHHSQKFYTEKVGNNSFAVVTIDARTLKLGEGDCAMLGSGRPR